MKYLIDITAYEGNMLRKKGRGLDVHMSSRSKKSRGKRYFLTESFKSLKILSDYRENIITFSRGDIKNE